MKLTGGRHQEAVTRVSAQRSDVCAKLHRKDVQRAACEEVAEAMRAKS